MIVGACCKPSLRAYASYASAYSVDSNLKTQVQVWSSLAQVKVDKFLPVSP